MMQFDECAYFSTVLWGKKNAAPEINSRFTFSNHRKNISEIKDTYCGGYGYTFIKFEQIPMIVFKGGGTSKGLKG